MKLSSEPRLLYLQPAQDLRKYVSGYHLFCVRPNANELYEDTFWPGWMHLRLKLLDTQRWQLKATGRDWFETGKATVFGPTSGAVKTRSECGVVVGAGITPVGWLALNLQSARLWADRVGSADQAGFRAIDSLHARALELDKDEDVKDLFDDYFREQINTHQRGLEMVEKIMQAMLDADRTRVGDLAQGFAISERTFQRLCAAAFGFAPQLLLRRARFLRSLAAIREVEPAERSASIDESYTDYSHFIRDSHRFLGKSPGAFLKGQSQMAVKSLEYRRKVLGQSTQALTSAGD